MAAFWEWPFTRDKRVEKSISSCLNVAFFIVLVTEKRISSNSASYHQFIDIRIYTYTRKQISQHNGMLTSPTDINSIQIVLVRIRTPRMA